MSREKVPSVRSISRNVSVARMLLKVAFYLIAMRLQFRFSNQFNAHDALAKVDAEHDLVKVAYAKKWTGARRAELQGDEVKVRCID